MKLFTIRLCLSSAIATISCVFVVILNQSHIWVWEHSQNHSKQFISPAIEGCIRLQHLAFAVPVMALALTLLKRKRLTRFIVRLLPELLYVFACAWLLYALFVWQIQFSGLHLQK